MFQYVCPYGTNGFLFRSFLRKFAQLDFRHMNVAKEKTHTAKNLQKKMRKKRENWTKIIGFWQQFNWQKVGRKEKQQFNIYFSHCMVWKTCWCKHLHRVSDIFASKTEVVEQVPMDDEAIVEVDSANRSACANVGHGKKTKPEGVNLPCRLKGAQNINRYRCWICGVGNRSSKRAPNKASNCPGVSEPRPQRQKKTVLYLLQNLFPVAKPVAELKTNNKERTNPLRTFCVTKYNWFCKQSFGCSLEVESHILILLLGTFWYLLQSMCNLILYNQFFPPQLTCQRCAVNQQVQNSEFGLWRRPG